MQDGGTTSVYGYDCFNRRVTKTVNGVTTRYVFLGADLAAEADVNWNQTASYFYQPGIDMPVSRSDPGGTVYYLQDHAGSVSALARPDGTIIGRYSYTPFGEVTADPGMPAQPLLWTARERDETGLYYLRARYYSPFVGRFLSEDPAGLAAGLNLYVFAGNSPVGMRDPLGLDAENLDDLDSQGDLLRVGWKKFKKDPMFRPGSPERRKMAAFASLTPGLGTGLSLYSAWTGNDLISGDQLSGFERGLNVVSLGVQGGGALICRMGRGTRRLAGAGSGGPTRLYHYTNAAGEAGIVADNALNPSLACGPDAAYGSGQYLTDIAPGSMPRDQMARFLWGQVDVQDRLDRVLTIDVTGLNVQNPREHVFLIPGDKPLDLTGRLINHGPH